MPALPALLIPAAAIILLGLLWIAARRQFDRIAEEDQRVIDQWLDDQREDADQ